MICPITNDWCRTNGCGEKCYKRDSLGYSTTSQHDTKLPVSGSVFYEVHFTDCFPRIFEVKEGQNINELVKAHIKFQNSGVPKSERIYLERIVRL